MGWFTDRFSSSPAKVQTACTVCDRAMWFPPSKAGKYPRCGKICSDAHSAQLKASRARVCEQCGVTFSPRPWQIREGGGRLCSRACGLAVMAAARTAESYARAATSRREAVASGAYVVPVGDAHPRWRGGKAESERRLRVSGKKAAGTRRYRAENPDKVREFTQRRQGRKLGRLPRGTVRAQGEVQGWRCFTCDVDIAAAYHVDHWMPLALGGPHNSANIRLLCPPCNVRKGAKHPDTFLAEIAA